MNTTPRSKDHRRKKRKVEPGIRKDAFGYEAYATLRTRFVAKRFPLDTPLSAMRRWREETKAQLVVDAELEPRPDVENLPRSLKGWCYIYVLRDGDIVKIGRAVNVKQRLTELKTGHHRPLTLMAAIPAHAALEAAIHERFARERQHGEWFVLSDSLRRFIEQAAAGANPVALLW